MKEPGRSDIAEAYRSIQSEICERIESADGKGQFSTENWEHHGGGGGTTRIMQQGAILEKAGVNFSGVEGVLTKEMAEGIGADVSPFFATGVSIVMHPHNPHVPIIHMNIRYFETTEGTYWFGGGIDLTPHYVNPDQARFFHESVKKVCDRFDKAYYPKFKKWADDYFYNSHRSETRGVGGIFYDRLTAGEEHSKSDILEFSLAIGRLFHEVYSELIALNHGKPFTEAERQWQLIRRGRYVEFNLVYDRGTRFGLFGNGRVESILMSLPALAAWEYNHIPEKGSPEAATLAMLRKGVDWVSIGK
ncbi:MAG: oxygen-dependent coproporphyrinogen oxidase [Flavobacteriales bacterium]|nr:oxygen-dependent coproporphyrinogen oxidase [Flavobacteriales bacterium]